MALDSQHVASGTTNRRGRIELNFTLLQGQKDYVVFVTAECPLPYNPRIRIADSNVARQDVTTPRDLTLFTTKDEVDA